MAANKNKAGHTKVVPRVHGRLGTSHKWMVNTETAHLTEQQTCQRQDICC